MGAEIIVYAFACEIAFAAMAAGALVALAALLKVIPRGVQDSPGRLDEHKESVTGGLRTVAGEHPDRAETSDHSSFAEIGS